MENTASLVAPGASSSKCFLYARNASTAPMKAPIICAPKYMNMFPTVGSIVAVTMPSGPVTE
ncbi:hypothetical protein M768_04350 [Cellulosimicrobium cellulans F16]|uniref:Uncharacterized protein n=1 Tax=Cellulosimicrobium cellulans F16 TaxID=1350482 RepID=A0A0M0FC60_CELCE|nr:hypothetical protein M768_04350 [Cellulosimicrobium cellulans F16]